MKKEATANSLVIRNTGQLKGAALISFMIVLLGAEIQNNPGYLGDSESVVETSGPTGWYVAKRGPGRSSALWTRPHEVLTSSP